MTAQARLHAAVTKPVPHLAPIHLVITYADAIELDRLIYDLRREESECSVCEARICLECGIGTDAYDCAETPGGPVKHCATCVAECSHCRDAMREDVRP